MVDLRSEARSSSAVIVFAFQELVQHLVVVFGNGFDQLGMEGFSLLLQFGGNFFGEYSAPDGVVLPHDRLHVDQVDDALELVFLTDGNLNRDGLGIEALADGIDGMLEIGAHLVDLVDEANSRDTVLVGLPPDFFRLRLHSVNRIKHRDRAIEQILIAIIFHLRHFGRKAKTETETK